ncbi:hypothetical protein OHS59_00345 [Streptomyces sp. NBC_00414]|uniref:hypothetical protein n=1 Tax=Streptomyces sp. NBC_00414 TaxID=2975739 RepID=UPI002E1F2673
MARANSSMNCPSLLADLPQRHHRTQADAAHRNQACRTLQKHHAYVVHRSEPVGRRYLEPALDADVVPHDPRGRKHHAPAQQHTKPHRDHHCQHHSSPHAQSMKAVPSC